MLVLENIQIAALAGNQAISKAFPIFAQLKVSLNQPNVGGGGCNCGGGSASSSPDYNKIKMSLATMSQADKDKFKKLSGFSSIKVVYAEGVGTKTVVL